MPLERHAAVRVGVVDDDPVTLEIVAAFLQADGCDVFTYESPGEFLASLNTIQLDCLVLDVFMPGCTGLEFLALLGGTQFRAPVIMMSGRGDIPLAVAAIQAGAFDFIEKPIRSD